MTPRIGQRPRGSTGARRAQEGDHPPEALASSRYAAGPPHPLDHVSQPGRDISGPCWCHTGITPQRSSEPTQPASNPACRWCCSPRRQNVPCSWSIPPAPSPGCSPGTTPVWKETTMTEPARVATAHLLPTQLGVALVDLQHSSIQRPPAPSMAEYLPRVIAAASPRSNRRHRPAPRPGPATPPALRTPTARPTRGVRMQRSPALLLPAAAPVRHL